jgi:hypothetical protein
MQPVTVLLVGQIRNQHVLMRSVGNLVMLRNDGLVSRIILATWFKELEKIGDLVPHLQAAGVMVTAAEEPDPQWFVPGHMMNQMRGIDLALETVEDDAWVLRARPDLLITRELVTKLAQADMALDPASPGGALAHKIWAPFAELTTPMCVSDIAFFGHYADIVKLQNFDFLHEVAASHLGTGPGVRPIACYDAEIRRYAPAFFAAYPVIAEYYRLYNRFFLGVYELRRSMLAMLFNEPYYWQYLGAYLDILRRYFLIGLDLADAPILLARPQAIDQREWLTCINLLGCEYAGEVLARDPDRASTLQLFADGPIYCKSSAEAQGVAALLERIGAPLSSGLAEATAHRKDAARIVGLHGFRERLNAALNDGVEKGRPKTPAWQNPFPTHFIGFAEPKDAAS